MDVPVNDDTNLGVASPCVRTCQLNDQDMCMGCFRMINEIAGWNQFTEEAKADVIEACRTRKRLGLSV